jgi:Domain of unknown function (DUF1992)
VVRIVTALGRLKWHRSKLLRRPPPVALETALQITMSRHCKEARKEIRNLRATLPQARPRPDWYRRRIQSSSDEQAKHRPEVDTPDDGAMARRLSEMTESALETGGKSARRAVEEAHFDESLRQRLQDRIASASLRSEHPSAFARVEAPPEARKDALEIAGAAWSGTETVEETSRRMLESSRKRAPSVPVRSLPARVRNASPGTRIENAVGQSAAYAALKESGMSAEEKEQFLKEQRERFQPGARDIPSTLSGLASLANERIEEAIARGQFKNLPRGRPQEVDHNSSSPFIDTTEYLMNKMIKRQDIVPPWIEKQKELSTAARRFRTRLRSDWKRHAARVIASHGGSLSQQMRRAEEFAAAEPSLTPKANAPGHMTPSLQAETPTTKRNLSSAVFRDSAWETAERAFHELSIKSLNSLTRTYNLMAPPAAQRPYYSLQRELKTCYADVAPLVGEEIRQRAMFPKRRHVVEGMSPSGDSASAAPLPAPSVSEFRWKDVWRDMWMAKGS